MARQAQLVSQHLENISLEALSKYQDVIRSYVRGRQGIYALYRKNELYYVGLASNLRSRLKHHLRDRHKKLWDRFSVYLTIGDSHLKELESLILRTVKPSGNHSDPESYVRQSIKLRASFRGALVKARVRRNGLIRYKNKDYNSPSHAASAVVKRSCNGWTFWKYERAPGDWVFLNELRR